MTTKDWRKEFDSMFDLDDCGSSHIVQKKVKSFIGLLLATQRAEFVDELRIVLAYLTDNQVDMRESAIRKVSELLKSHQDLSHSL